MLMEIVTIIGLMFLFSTSLYSGDPPTSRFVLNFNGPINDITVRSLEEIIKSYPHDSITINITSTGGDGQSAMHLGDLIRDRGVYVVVRGYCHSACSHYVLTSSERTIVEEGATILFHGSPTMLNLGDDAPIELRSRHYAFLEQERLFFERRGIDYQKWKWLLWQIKPQCSFRDDRFSPADPRHYGYRHQYSATSATLPVLQDIGLNQVDGFFPSNSEQNGRLLSDQGLNQNASIVFIDKIPDEIQSFHKLPHCQDEG